MGKRWRPKHISSNPGQKGFGFRAPHTLSTSKEVAEGHRQFLLDTCSELNLKTWRSIQESVNLYHYTIYYYMEAQRAGTVLYEVFNAPGWRFMPTQYDIPANSQIFGSMLHKAGFDGVVYQSTKGK